MAIKHFLCSPFYFNGLWNSYAAHPKCLPLYLFLWIRLGVNTSWLIISTCLFSNQNLFLTFFLFFIGWRSCISRFPSATGEALGIIGRLLVSHFSSSKSKGMNLRVLLRWNSWPTRHSIASWTTLNVIKKQQLEIISRLESTQAVFLRKSQLVSFLCGLHKKFKGP